MNWDDDETIPSVKDTYCKKHYGLWTHECGCDMKKKKKKKATVFPKFEGYANNSGNYSTDNWPITMTARQRVPEHRYAMLSLPLEQFSKLTKKQRKLYKIPEGVK